MILGFPYDQKIDLWLGELGSNESVELTHDELTSRFDVEVCLFVSLRGCGFPMGDIYIYILCQSVTAGVVIIYCTHSV